MGGISKAISKLHEMIENENEMKDDSFENEQKRRGKEILQSCSFLQGKTFGK